MNDRQLVTCLDLEGVLVPEIWIAMAQETGIAELRLTTRDIADYDELMTHRLRLLDQHGLGLSDIQRVIATLHPFEGAAGFVDSLRDLGQVIILSDTFEEFAAPLMAQLGRPTIFCHRLVTDGDHITGYRLRMPDQKRAAVAALQSLNFAVVASGDSYNDTGMLAQADAGFLFRAPQQVIAEFPQFPLNQTYGELLARVRQFCDR